MSTLIGGIIAILRLAIACSNVACLFAKRSDKSLAQSDIARTASHTHKNKVCVSAYKLCLRTNVTARRWRNGV